jgi:hypothetical protein
LSDITIYIEPPYPSLCKDKLFDASAFQDPSMVIPFANMRKYFNDKGVSVHTADLLRAKKGLSKYNYYYSFGDVTYFKDPTGDDEFIEIIFGSFVAFETPLIQPIIYANMSELLKRFKHVFAYNKSLTSFSTKYRHLYFPAPYKEVISHYWANTVRSEKFVMISGNHRPRKGFKNELYSERLNALRFLAKKDLIDLYGRGWKKFLSRNVFWFNYWRSLYTIIKTHKGECESKLEVLSKYCFSVCFENMRLDGYITEKVFDCFYSGCIPLYWGPMDIDKFIPKASYINVNDFDSLEDAIDFAIKMPNAARERMRLSGKRFIENNHLPYTESIIDIILSGLVKPDNEK